MNRYWLGFSVVFALVFALVAAMAQSITGNVSLPVGTSSASVQLPSAGPALMIMPQVGNTTEVFYELGTAPGTTASIASPSLPPGGVCFPNSGPNKYLAAIVASPGPATLLRVTQLTQCPSIVGWGGGGGSTPPGTCSYSLDFSKACNSQYFLLLLY